MNSPVVSTPPKANLLFGGNILRGRYESPEPPMDPLLKKRIDHLLWVARNGNRYPSHWMANVRVVPDSIVPHPLVRPDESAYPFLAWLLTGEIAFAKAGREKLFELAESVAVRETGDGTQGHCWCDSFPFSRWLMLADWIWESPALSDSDRERLRERFLYYLWAHPFQRLKTRAIEGTPFNNQNASMAIACLTGGHLFGQKYGTDSRAVKMLHLGLMHLRTFLTSFPKGGYSFEGSVYMSEVNSPIFPLALELIEASTGEDLFECAANADCATPREFLECVMRLSSPSGLLHPWDNYGYKRADFTSQAAYLAFRTGDSRPLRFLEELGALEEPASIGWGLDKTLWTLLWMLRADAAGRDDNEEWSFSFAEPSLCAGVAGPDKKLFVLQMWDRSSSIPTRAHFNPNALILEYGGSPLLLDGNCVEFPKAVELEQEKYLYFKPDSNKTLSFGLGTVGAHNCVFFDDEDAYFSSQSSEGELVFYREDNEVCLFEADVTDCYRDRYDVSRVRRATLALGDDAVLVRDRIVSESPHKVTWRAHAREGETEVRKGYFSVRTRESARLEICLPNETPLDLRHFVSEGPAQLEGSCHEVSYYAHGSDLTLYTLFVPSADLEDWIPLREGWEWCRAEKDAEIETLRANWHGAEPIDFSERSWFFTTGCHEPGIGIYRCEVDLGEELPETAWLRLPRYILSPRLWVNGKEVEVRIPPEGGPVTTHLPLMPHIVEIGAALNPGKNRIEIASTSTLETALRGAVSLLKPAVKHGASRIAQTRVGNADVLEIRHRDRTERIEWNDDTCVVTRWNGTKTTLSLAPCEPPPRQIPAPVPDFDLPHEAPSAEDADSLAQKIRSSDWRIALDALERADGRPEAALVEAAWEVLQNEIQTHETSPRRDPEDLCWYRLKAAAIKVLGTARFEPATRLIGEQLLNVRVFYPVRAAGATALGRIGTPEAINYLKRVPQHEEHNTRLTVQRELSKVAKVVNGEQLSGGNGSAPGVGEEEEDFPQTPARANPAAE